MRADRGGRVVIRSEGGFTLLEAVVAVTIVGLAAVSSLAAFGAELRAGGRAQRALELEALADEALARIRLLPVASLVSLPDSLRSGYFAPPFETYHWMSLVSPVIGEPGLYDVSIVVRGSDDAPIGAPAAPTRQISTRLYRPARGGSSR
jgi:hypothetical protein